jgi:hypothetical protein
MNPIVIDAVLLDRIGYFCLRGTELIRLSIYLIAKFLSSDHDKNNYKLNSWFVAYDCFYVIALCLIEIISSFPLIEIKPFTPQFFSMYM